MSRRPRRVLVLPQEIAGVSAGLVSGIRANGVDADLLVRTRHPFAYARPEPSVPGLARAQARLDRWQAVPVGSRLRQLGALVRRAVLLPFVLRHYDALVYVGPTTLTGLAVERRLARLLGRTVVTVFLGSDSRPPYLSGYFIRPEHGEPDVESVDRMSAATARRVRRAEASSSYVVNHPMTAQFHRRSYVDFTSLGLPVDLGDAADERPAHRGGPVRVVHAPSMAPWKGTDRIREAIRALQDDGLAVDYVELAGVPHDEVITTVRDADLVVDELYSDALLAGLSTEAAALGVAPLVLGYAGRPLAEMARAVGAPSEHYRDPATLPEALRELLTDAPRRQAIARGLQEFVTGHWAPREVGARYLRLLQEGPDPRWMRRPADSDYVAGWGVEAAERRAFLGRYLAERGERAFHLEPGSRLLGRLRAEAADRSALERPLP
jgi:glycosyltransferase involved in cell wall biosynthesis